MRRVFARDFAAEIRPGAALALFRVFAVPRLAGAAGRHRRVGAGAVDPAGAHRGAARRVPIAHADGPAVEVSLVDDRSDLLLQGRAVSVMCRSRSPADGSPVEPADPRAPELGAVNPEKRFAVGRGVSERPRVASFAIAIAVASLTQMFRGCKIERARSE